MKSDFAALAEELKKIGQEKFLQRYKFPFLIQMRDYPPAVHKNADITARVETNMIRRMESQLEEQKDYSEAVIWLSFKKGNEKEKVLGLGRSKQNDIVLDWPLISKFHAQIRMDKSGRKFQIADIGSTNQTFLNFRQLNPGEFYNLQGGDLICLGGAYNFIFYPAERFYHLLDNYLKKHDA